jgi:Cd2+/Zn2+-exporting ATPase
MSNSHGPSRGDHERVELQVPEMDCPSCASKVEHSVRSLDGIRAIEPQVTTGTLSVSYDRERATRDAVVERVESAGYAVAGSDRDAEDDETPDGIVWRSRRAKTTAVSGAFLGFGLLAEYAVTGAASLTAGGIAFTLAELLFVAAVATSGGAILRNGYYSARNLSLDMDFLMSAAIVSAVLASLIAETSLYFEAATLAVLFSVSELAERYAMGRTRNSLRELMDLSPNEATVVHDGEETTVPVGDVAVGDCVVVRPGEKIPMDGEVVTGESAVNQSPITGESVPVEKEPGDEVYAGTITEDGSLDIEVTAESGDNTLARIIELVEDAKASETEQEQFVERFAGYYTPVMVAVAVLVATIPPLVFGANWVRWFVAGITMLVLACPCAFVISTPVSVVSAITSAAKNGVLVKGGTHLEAMGGVNAVAFDKTGTLTAGELAVTDVIPLNGNDEEAVLRCARGLEARSEHPIGEAIVARADEASVGSREVMGFESLTGRGVHAELDGIPHYAGKPGLFEELGFDLEHARVAGDSLAEDTISRLQHEGKTVVLVGCEDELEGMIAVADAVRPEAKSTIERLHDRGVTTVMLTGDNQGTAQAVAEQVGVADYRAGLLPDEKVGAVEDLREEYGRVAMVGDGINDAPALATATVGIAMGAAGTDTALETADIALMADDVAKLPYVYDLSNAATGVIRQNIWASLGMKAILAAGVPLGYVSVALAVLAGDAGMTLGVTGNALRLSRLTPTSED